MRQDFERMTEIAARMRKYASFFEWPDKDRKELGIVDELVSGLNGLGLRLRHLRVQRPDPPDCVGEDQNGNSVAIEVAEIICEDAARLNARGHKVCRAWRPGDLGATITASLSKKDTKTYHGGPFSTIAVCLFTDEPMLTVDFAKRELASLSFGPYKQIDAAYLLFSYDPGSKGYPIVTLRLAE